MLYDENRQNPCVTSVIHIKSMQSWFKAGKNRQERVAQGGGAKRLVEEEESNTTPTV